MKIKWIEGNHITKNSPTTKYYIFCKWDKKGNLIDGFFDTDKNGKNFYKQYPHLKNSGFIGG